MQQMQQTHGNRAVQRCVQRQVSPGAIPVQREEEKSWWDEYKNPIGLANDITGGVTSTLGTLGDMASIGLAHTPTVSIGLGRTLPTNLPQWLTKLPGGGNYSPLARTLSRSDTLLDMGSVGNLGKAGPLGSAMSKVGTAANVLGIGLGLEKMYNGKGYDVLEGGADATASAIGLHPHPLAKSFSAGYGVGRLLDQGVGWGMGELSQTDMGKAMGMNPGGDYSLSGMMGKHAFNMDRQFSSYMPWYDKSLEYNPETDDPTKIDESYKNTMAYKINEVLDSEAVTRAKDEFLADPTGLRRSYKELSGLYEEHLSEPLGDFGSHAGNAFNDIKEDISNVSLGDIGTDITDTYHDVKEDAGEMLDNAGDYAEEKVEAIKEYIPDIELPSLPSIPSVKPPWEWGS
jgi:hypothetical protein